MSTGQPREAAGIPTGGRFAPTRRPEAVGVELVDDEAWPAIDYEELEWVSSDTSFFPASRRVRAAGHGPYRAAVLPPIASVAQVPLPPEVATEAADAAVEVARFDAELGGEIAPFAAILLRTESMASSKIEHLTASVRAIAAAEVGDRSRRNASLIVANTHAMTAAVELADHLDEASILAMHRALMEDEHPEWAGRWRTEQVWIGGSDYSPHLADFVPPHHGRVPASIADLVAFMSRSDIPPLVQAAVAHAQFESIHPFPDGNGRVGRALVHALLRSKGLTRNITVPISAGLLTDTDAYFAALDAYHDGDPAPIVLRFSEASFSAIDNGRQLVRDIRDVRQRWDEVIEARRGATPHALADLLVRQPVVDSPFVQRELGVSAQNVNLAIRRLVEAGVLSEIGKAERNRKWEAREVLVALDAFAARAGRRAAGTAR